MSDLLGVKLPEFLTEADGEIRISGHRISLFDVLWEYNHGQTVEELALRFPTVKRATLLKIIAFYLDHQPEVDRYLAGYSQQLDDKHLTGSGAGGGAGHRLLSCSGASNKSAGVRTMPLKYLIDENLRGKFVYALIAHALKEGFATDIVETGEPNGPALGGGDDELLRWCEEHGRVLVSLDKTTLPKFLEAHLQSGRSSPGIILIRRGRPWQEILHYLVLSAEARTAEECENRCIYIPE